MSDAFQRGWLIAKGYDIWYDSDADWGNMPPISGTTLLRDPEGYTYPVRKLPPALEEGWTYHTEPRLAITYNHNPGYGGHYPRSWVREVYGMTGAESMPILEEILAHLEEKAMTKYGEKLNRDWVAEYDAGVKGRWKKDGLEGLHNAAEPVRTMINFARHDPDGIWQGD